MTHKGSEQKYTFYLSVYTECGRTGLAFGCCFLGCSMLFGETPVSSQDSPWLAVTGSSITHQLSRQTELQYKSSSVTRHRKGSSSHQVAGVQFNLGGSQADPHLFVPRQCLLVTVQYRAHQRLSCRLLLTFLGIRGQNLR